MSSRRPRPDEQEYTLLEQTPTRTVTLARDQLLQAATRAASLSAAVKAGKSPVTITVTSDAGRHPDYPCVRVDFPNRRVAEAFAGRI